VVHNRRETFRWKPSPTGESDGVNFLTMQLVDSQPLDRLISQGGLAIERVVEIGSALADPLAAGSREVLGPSI